MSEDIYTPEHTFRTKTDLNVSGGNQPKFNSIFNTQVSENISSSKSQEFFDNNSFALSTAMIPSQKRYLPLTILIILGI